MDARTPTTRTQRRVARTEAAIEAAAERLFLTRGFRDTRIEDLAERADVAVGSIYRHFGSKLGLYLSVVESAMADHEAALEGVYAADLPPVDRLPALGRAYVDFAIEEPTRFQLLNEAWIVIAGAQSAPELDRTAQLEKRGLRLLGALEETLAAGVADGSLRPLDATSAARFLWGAWTGALALRLRADRLGVRTAEEVRAVVEAGIDIVTSGLLVTQPDLESGRAT